MTARRSFLVALALVFVAGAAHARCEDVAPGQRPQNSPREFVGRSLDDIVASGFIEIAVYEDNAPYSWEEGGKPMGVDVGVGRIIAESLGVEPHFRFVTAGESLDADLLNYVWKGAAIGGHVSDVMLRVPYDSDFACRVDQVVFTGQYADERIAVAYSLAAYPEAIPGASAEGRHKGAPVAAFFTYDDVGVENDSISDFYLTSLPGGGTGEKIHRYKTTAAAMEALNAGELMGVMGPLAQLQHGAGPGVAVHSPPMMGFAVSRWTLGAAVHTSHRDLGYAVDEAIAAALADGRIAAIYADLGLLFLPPER